MIFFDIITFEKLRSLDDKIRDFIRDNYLDASVYGPSKRLESYFGNEILYHGNAVLNWITYDKIDASLDMFDLEPEIIKKSLDALPKVTIEEFVSRMVKQDMDLAVKVSNDYEVDERILKYSIESMNNEKTD